MEIVTLKLARRQVLKLRARAAAAGRSQAAIVGELIDDHLAGRTPSLHNRAEDLCGSVSAPPDAATRTLKGYGRD